MTRRKRAQQKSQRRSQQQSAMPRDAYEIYNDHGEGEEEEDDSSGESSSFTDMGSWTSSSSEAE